MALIMTRRDGTEHRCLYDASDHALVAAHQWHWRNGYVVRNILNRHERGVIQLHRAVLGIARLGPERVDHINGNRLDDRKVNLRIDDGRVNFNNRAVINELGTSQYRGVCWDKSKGRWKAYTRIDGRMCNVGYYVSEDEAAEAIARFRARRGIEPGYPQRHPETPSRSVR